MTIDIEDRLRQAHRDGDASTVVPEAVVRAINRRRRAKLSLASGFAVVAVGGATVGIVAAVNGSNGSQSQELLTSPPTSSESPAQIVRAFLPGARVGLSQHMPSFPGPGLEISLPNTYSVAGLTMSQANFQREDLGWRAQLAVDLVTKQMPRLKSWTMQGDEVKPRTVAENFFHGSAGVGRAAEAAGLDSISLVEATRQLESSLQTLFSVLPTAAHPSDSITTYSIPSGRNEFALAVHVTVSTPQSMNGYYGDVLPGLETGLDNLIEGTAIVVTSADGTPILGGWHSQRVDTGGLSYGNSAEASQSMNETTTFPNLTGGEAPTGDAHG